MSSPSPYPGTQYIAVVTAVAEEAVAYVASSRIEVD